MGTYHRATVEVFSPICSGWDFAGFWYLPKEYALAAALDELAGGQDEPARSNRPEKLNSSLSLSRFLEKEASRAKLSDETRELASEEEGYCLLYALNKVDLLVLRNLDDVSPTAHSMLRAIEFLLDFHKNGNVRIFLWSDQ